MNLTHTHTKKKKDNHFKMAKSLWRCGS